MSTERLVLALEEDVPTGVTIERVTMAMLQSGNEGCVIFTSVMCDRPAAELHSVPAHIAEQMDLGDVMSDEDGNVYGVIKPDSPMRILFPAATLRPVYRARFDAGPIARYERFDAE